MDKENNLRFKKDDNVRYGYVEENDNWVIEPKFDIADDFVDGETMVELDEKPGYILSDGTYHAEE